MTLFHLDHQSWHQKEHTLDCGTLFLYYRRCPPLDIFGLMNRYDFGSMRSALRKLKRANSRFTSKANRDNLLPISLRDLEETPVHNSRNSETFPHYCSGMLRNIHPSFRVPSVAMLSKVLYDQVGNVGTYPSLALSQPMKVPEAFREFQTEIVKMTMVCMTSAGIIILMNPIKPSASKVPVMIMAFLASVLYFLEWLSKAPQVSVICAGFQISALGFTILAAVSLSLLSFLIIVMLFLSYKVMK